MTRPTSKGKPILDYITAEWYNKVSWMVDHYRQHVPKPVPFPETQCLINKMHNAGEETIDAYDACIVDGSQFISTRTSLLRPSMVVPKCYPKDHALGNYHNWYITERPVTPGKTGRIITQGMCWLKFTQDNPYHKFVWGYDPIADAVISGIAGKARILVKPNSETAGYGCVYLGEFEAPNYTAYLPFAIPPGTTIGATRTFGTGTGLILGPVFTNPRSLKESIGGGSESRDLDYQQIVVYNDQPTTITGDRYVQIKFIEGKYFIDTASC